jgi:ATP-dependent RNA helicase DHX8/PRP22
MDALLDLEKLNFISVVSKVCTELENHLGFSDKDLAEFVIHLAQKNDSRDTFCKDLNENGADFPQDFAENLYTIIGKMLPKSKPNDAKKQQNIISSNNSQHTIPEDDGTN